MKRLTKQVKTDNSPKAITLSKAWMLSKSWKRASIIWRFLDHFFAMGSFAASISTVYIASGASEDNPLIIVLSSISAFLSLSGFACNPRKYMTGYRKAFQELNHALVEHTDESGRYRSLPKDRDAVMRAIQRGERYISETYELEAPNEREMGKRSHENCAGYQLKKCCRASRCCRKSNTR